MTSGLNKKIYEYYSGWKNRGYRWNSSWAGFQPSGRYPSCCGGEPNKETEATGKHGEGNDSDSLSDWACCDDSTGCTYDSGCFEQCEDFEVESRKYVYICCVTL